MKTTILGHRVIVEPDGWLHTVTFQTENGATVTIEDDTDMVTAFSDQPDAIKGHELAQLWGEWGMGTSSFPLVEMPDKNPIPWYKLEHQIVMEMPGEMFSRIG